MAPATPKFIADVMLGRLAKWLRLLGLDTAYDAHSSNVALLRRANAEGRILLTRDRRLLARPSLPPYLYIAADDFRAQLRQVLDSFGIDPWQRRLQRCSRCNALLERVDKADIERWVPPYVWSTQALFSRCPVCGRVYWPATHVERIESELRRLYSDDSQYKGQKAKRKRQK